MMRTLFLAALLLVVADSASAQQGIVYQTGSITPGHTATWATNGVIQDGGAPPFNVTWPSLGDLVISSSTNTPTGLAPVNGQCAIGAAGVWTVGTCGGGSGTVTSVGLTVPSWLTVVGSPITTFGTLAVTGTSESANFFLASPNGSAGAMTPRAIVPSDLPLATNGNPGAVEPDGTSITISGGIISSISGAVTSVSNSDGTLNVSPTAGNVIASLDLGNPNTWAGLQSFTNGNLSLLGSSSGSSTLEAPATGGGTVTFPPGSVTLLSNTLANTDFLVGNVSGVATPVAMSGSCSLANTGVVTCNLGGTPLQTFTLSGNTTSLATTSGTLTNTHCVEINATGNFVDAGGTCTTGGGGGTVNSGTGPAIAQYVAGTDTVVGPATVSGDATIAQGGALTVGSIGGKTVSLGGALTTAAALTQTGAGAMTLAGPSGAATFTLPGASDTLAGVGTVQTFTAAQSFTNGDLQLLGSSSGHSTLEAPASGGGVVTLPGGAVTLLGNGLASADIFVGNGSSVATGVAVSGDLTITNAGVTTVGAIQGRTVPSGATTDGELLIGNTSTGNWNEATLTAGSNVTITNAGGSITIASTAAGSACPSGVTTWDGTTNLTVSATTGLVYTIGSTPVAASRTLTLPVASVFGAGCTLQVVDAAKIFNVTNPVTPTRQGSDTIDGSVNGTAFEPSSTIVQTGQFIVAASGLWNTLKAPSVSSFGPTTHQWANSLTASGFTTTQPAFTDLSGNIAVSQMNSGTGALGSTSWNGTGAWIAQPVNPIAYGASTGSADNATDMNNAEVAAYLAGVPLLIPAGNWNMKSPLELFEGSIITGQGVSSCLVNNNSGSPFPLIAALLNQPSGTLGIATGLQISNLCLNLNSNVGGGLLAEATLNGVYSRIIFKNVHSATSGTWTWTGDGGSTVFPSFGIGIVGHPTNGGYYNRIINPYGINGGSGVTGDVGIYLSSTGSTGRANVTQIEGGVIQGQHIGIQGDQGSDVIVRSTDVSLNDIGKSIGTGANPVQRWRDNQPYCETETTACIELGVNSMNVTIDGMASSAGTTNPVKVDSGAQFGVFKSTNLGNSGNPAPFPIAINGEMSDWFLTGQEAARGVNSLAIGGRWDCYPLGGTLTSFSATPALSPACEFVLFGNDSATSTPNPVELGGMEIDTPSLLTPSNHESALKWWTIANGSTTRNNTMSLSSSLGMNVNLNSAAGAAPAVNGLQLVGADTAFVGYSADAFAAVPIFTCRRADGTNGSKTTVLAGDVLCQYGVRGYDGSSYSNAQATILSSAVTNWSTSSHDTAWTFNVTPTGSTTVTQAAKIFQDGGVTVGSPTGGDEGSGTVNSTGCFVNGTACNLTHFDIGYIAGVNLSTNPTEVSIALPVGMTITSMVGHVGAAVGGTATIDIYEAPSGTACASGTKLTDTTNFNANGTANTDQTLAGTTATITASDRLCLVAAGAGWSSSVGTGGITVWAHP